jgi:hypothetical protein
MRGQFPDEPVRMNLSLQTNSLCNLPDVLTIGDITLFAGNKKGPRPGSTSLHFTLITTELKKIECRGGKNCHDETMMNTKS